MNGNGLYGRLGLAIALLTGFSLLSVENMNGVLYTALVVIGIAGLTAFVINPKDGEG